MNLPKKNYMPLSIAGKLPSGKLKKLCTNNVHLETHGGAGYTNSPRWILLEPKAACLAKLGFTPFTCHTSGQDKNDKIHNIN